MRSIEFKFNEGPNLGDVVSNAKAFCKLTKQMPVPSFQYVVGDFNNPMFHGLAGHKWSRLCGFTFKSSVNTASPTFQFVYVPKLKGFRANNTKSLHGWYCWKYETNFTRMVMSIDDMMKVYKFDINKFVFSDMFNQTVPKFVSNVQYVLDHQIKQLVDSLDSIRQHEILRYVHAIKVSLETIYDVQQFVHYEDDEPEDNAEGTYAQGSSPKDGHVKIGYNADKTYSLPNLDKQRQDDHAAEVRDMLDNMRKNS